jgi:hypothetical protein
VEVSAKDVEFTYSANWHIEKLLKIRVALELSKNGLILLARWEP